MKIACDALKLEVPADWRAQRTALVKQQAVFKLFKLPATALIGADGKMPTGPPISQCACGNFAKPGSDLCNACTAKASVGATVGASAAASGSSAASAGAGTRK